MLAVGGDPAATPSDGCLPETVNMTLPWNQEKQAYPNKDISSKNHPIFQGQNCLLFVSGRGFFNKATYNKSHYVTHLGGVKQYKSMVILRDFPYTYTSAKEFGLVPYFMTPVWFMNTFSLTLKCRISSVAVGDFFLIGLRSLRSKGEKRFCQSTLLALKKCCSTWCGSR